MTIEASAPRRKLSAILMIDVAGFDSVLNAVRCAQAIQEAQAAANTHREPAERMEIRIGVHLGDVIVQDYRVYGDGVNIAARLQTVADPGSICISEAVYQQVYTKVDLAFEDLGVRELKNIEHPIRIEGDFSVRPFPGTGARERRGGW